MQPRLITYAMREGGFAGPEDVSWDVMEKGLA